jgi:hypothetical protein
MFSESTMLTRSFQKNHTSLLPTLRDKQRQKAKRQTMPNQVHLKSTRLLHQKLHPLKPMKDEKAKLPILGNTIIAGRAANFTTERKSKLGAIVIG